MTSVKLSVAIPYKQRLDNLRLVFEGLAHQTMDRSQFEVVVGAMEYCEDYVALCREFTKEINIRSVLSAEPFEIPHARNLAMRGALGQVVVQMDADTLLPPNALQNLWDRHFAFGQNSCVVGQVVGYGNNEDGDVDAVEVQPYAHYVPLLDEIGASRGDSKDPRFQADHVIPWAFAWTGLVALPMAVVRDHDLFFDQDFRGWGVDDLEWAYRVCASGTPIILREDVYAIHLPHRRDSAANRETEKGNYRRFLRKWPRPDVELAYAFGDVNANSLFLDHLDHVRRQAGNLGRTLGAVRTTVDGSDVLFLGVILDADLRVADPRLGPLLDAGQRTDVLELLGLALPYENGDVDECRLLPTLSGFPTRYGEAIGAEAERVAKRVVRID
ncbi:glycosyltransferase family 2 protein [Streptomyces sp. NPDC094034]|uniref:glycosyltransferase family 2 protein n=1 Tax=Streptomyces sp. NPDC094034 TaxID=3155309 RepID=UPI00332DDE82